MQTPNAFTIRYRNRVKMLMTECHISEAFHPQNIKVKPKIVYVNVVVAKNIKIVMEKDCNKRTNNKQNERKYKRDDFLFQKKITQKYNH